MLSVSFATEACYMIKKLIKKLKNHFAEASHHFANVNYYFAGKNWEKSILLRQFFCQHK